MEGLKECEANLTAFIHPSKAIRVKDAILRELSSLLYTYSDTLDGVVLAYDPNIRSNLAKIIPGIQPYFGINLKARFLLFDPKPGMLLEGEVVKVTTDSIQAIVLGFCTAVIGVEETRGEFKHTIKHGEGLFVSQSYMKHRIKVGTILRFTVKSFDEEVLYVSGSLMAEHTGCARWLDKNPDSWSLTDKSSRKRKVLENGENSEKGRQIINKNIIGDKKIDIPDEPTTDKETTAMKTDEQRTKSKKRKKDRH